MAFLSDCIVCFFFLMKRRPPRSTQGRSSAASDGYKRQEVVGHVISAEREHRERVATDLADLAEGGGCLLGTNRRGAVDAELPVEGLRDERLRRLPATAEDEPVSYTHLRAHETVLVLVCRLLLEKK